MTSSTRSITSFRGPSGAPVVAKAGEYDHLFRNDGPGPDGVPRFIDVTKAAGVLDNGLGLSATWWDYDGDGGTPTSTSPTITSVPDRLWHNTFTGDGTFSRPRTGAPAPHRLVFHGQETWATSTTTGRLDFPRSPTWPAPLITKDKMSMGEMDQLGWFLESPTPRQIHAQHLFLNSGAGPFMEIAHLAGVAATDWTWAVKFGDLDCDGWLDLYVTNGMTGDFLNSDLLAAADQTLAPAMRRSSNDPNMAFRKRAVS